MSIESILTQIDAEIARLTQVRSLLANTGKVTTKAVEPKSKKTPTKAKAKVKKTRVLSPEARKRIADAQRKRWAAQKAKS
jgi:hypothetical protein